MYTAQELQIKELTTTLMGLITKASQLKNPCGGAYAYEAGALSAHFSAAMLLKDADKVSWLNNQIKWYSAMITEMENQSA